MREARNKRDASCSAAVDERRHDAAARKSYLRLSCMWARTKWPAESAERRESSPAMTVAATTIANCRAFVPGLAHGSRGGIVAYCRWSRALDYPMQAWTWHAWTTQHTQGRFVDAAHLSVAGPATPRRSRQAFCAARWVPPPTVPTSMDGIVQLMCKSIPSFDGVSCVMQLDDSTFCAGSCPQAM